MHPQVATAPSPPPHPQVLCPGECAYIGYVKCRDGATGPELAAAAREQLSPRLGDPETVEVLCIRAPPGEYARGFSGSDAPEWLEVRRPRGGERLRWWHLSRRRDDRELLLLWLPKAPLEVGALVARAAPGGGGVRPAGAPEAGGRPPQGLSRRARAPGRPPPAAADLLTPTLTLNLSPPPPKGI